MEQIVYTLNHAEADLIITHASFLPILENIWKDLKTVKAVVVMVEDGQRPDTKIPMTAEYQELLRSGAFPYPFLTWTKTPRPLLFIPPGRPDPKGVYFTHRQLVLHTLSVSVMIGSFEPVGWFRSDDVYMPLTPMFHVHAWGYPDVLTPPGAKAGLSRPIRTGKNLATDRKGKGHLFALCPDHIADALKLSGHRPGRSVPLESGYRRRPVPKGLAKAAQDRGIAIQAGYGMSETCPVMTAAIPQKSMLDWPEDQLRDVLIKTGKPIPLAEVEVVDPEDRILSHDGVSKGEVVMRSPWPTQGYFKEPEKTKELWRSGWLHSGDVGYIDQEGDLQITDRIKDVIKSGGEWVSSPGFGKGL